MVDSKYCEIRKRDRRVTSDDRRVVLIGVRTFCSYERTRPFHWYRFTLPFPNDLVTNDGILSRIERIDKKLFENNSVTCMLSKAISICACSMPADIGTIDTLFPR